MKFSHDELSMLFLQLALFLHAGAQSGGALALLAEESPSPETAGLLNTMAADVDGGGTLSGAMEQSGAFPREAWSLLAVGEKTGRSEETLRALSRYYDRKAQMDRRLRAALLYPSLLLLILLAVIVVLLTRVLPIFSEVYASLGGQLTGVAGALLRVGLALGRFTPLLCVLLVLCALFVALFAGVDRFRGKTLELWSGLRGESPMARKQNLALFAQGLSMALSAGLPPQDAVTTAASLLPARSPLRERCARCARSMAAGESTGKALRAHQILPPAECRLLELGLATGSGEDAMEEAARRLDRAAEDSLERSVSRVEPAMVLGASLLVGAVLLAVMLPLANIMTAIG